MISLTKELEQTSNCANFFDLEVGTINAKAESIVSDLAFHYATEFSR